MDPVCKQVLNCWLEELTPGDWFWGGDHIRHHEIIKMFSRFPHRNAVLGRKYTPGEEVFLQQPFSSF